MSCNTSADRPFPVGLSTCGKKRDSRLFADCAAAGIECLEISPGQSEYDEVDYARLYGLSREYGVRLHSFHLPFMPFESVDISALDASVRETTVKRDAELIKKAADIGIGIFVIHASGEPIADGERCERMKAAKDSLARLAETADRAGGKLAIEDLPRTCLGRDGAEIKELLSPDGRLGVCFDTNHLLTESPESFLAEVGSMIITTHVSDYDFIDEKHWLPGEGKIDWQSLLTALKATGYRGPWMYELGFAAPRSRPRSRDLTPYDFAANADAIFHGLPPAVLL